MNQIYSSEDEHVQRGDSRLHRKLDKDRFALFHAEVFYNDYLSKTLVFYTIFFTRFIGYISIFFCDCAILFVRAIIILNRKNNTQMLLVYLPCRKQELSCACSRLVHQQRRKNNVVRWHLPLLENPCCISVRRFTSVLNINTCVNPLIKTL